MASSGQQDDAVIVTTVQGGAVTWYRRPIFIIVAVLLLTAIGFVVWKMTRPEAKQSASPRIDTQQQLQATADANQAAAANALDADSKTAALTNAASRYLVLGNVSAAELAAQQAVEANAPTVSIKRAAVLALADIYARQQKYSEAAGQIKTLQAVAGNDAEELAFQAKLDTLVAAYENKQTPTFNRACEPTPENKECSQ